MRPLHSAVLAALVVAGCTETTRSEGREADGPHPVSAPAPEQMEARAARHAPCGLVPLAEEAGATVRLRDDPAVSLRLPSGYVPLDGEEEASFQGWIDVDSTLLMVGVSSGGQFATALDGEEPVDEGECSQRFAGRLSTVGRAWLDTGTRWGTVYLANVDVAHQADRWIGVGVLARTAEARERALAAVATLRVDER